MTKNNPRPFLGSLVPAPTTAPPEPQPKNIFLTFDSGRGLSFPEAAHHTLITGSTGCGKTTSAVLPALDRLISSGFAGLIIDVKNNLTEKVATLAGQYGRAGDILELGTGPQARPLNILDGLQLDEILALFRSFTLKDVRPGHNMIWYLSGVTVAADLVRLCRALTRLNPRFKPSLAVIAELLTDFPLCAALFDLLKSSAETDEDKDIIRKIGHNCFHPCNWKSNKDDQLDDYEEQAEWRTYAARLALSSLRQTPGFERGFCALEGEKPDMEKWIYEQGKIVVLRFGPKSGSAGEDLARLFLEKFYLAVFNRGLDLPAGRYTFMAADEFQDFADFNRHNRYNDLHFTSKSREFNNIFLAATQSIASLTSRGADPMAVEAFLNNCNNRLMFYSDDPWTQNVASRHEQNVFLSELGPGETVFVKFNLSSRRHEHGLDRLQKAHDLGQRRLQAVSGTPVIPAGEIQEPVPITAAQIWETLEKTKEERLENQPETQPEQTKRPAPFPPSSGPEKQTEVMKKIIARRDHSEPQGYIERFRQERAFERNKDKTEAIKSLRLTAEKGRYKAQYHLGCLYSNGEGVPKDQAEAAAWFKRAAEGGHRKAQRRLAQAFYQGQGVTEDKAEALKWFRLAAGKGDPKAQCHLGEAYRSGDGVPPDQDMALAWFQKAAAQGDPDAQFFLLNSAAAPQDRK